MFNLYDIRNHNASGRRSIEKNHNHIKIDVSLPLDPSKHSSVRLVYEDYEKDENGNPIEKLIDISIEPKTI